MRPNAFDPYLPLNELKPFGPNIWIVDGPEIAMDFPLGMKVPFPTRMVVVRLQDGRIWVHSPIEPTPHLCERLRDLGDVAYLVAPNSIHYWFLPEWAEAFPQAQCYVAPGVLERAEGRKTMPPATLLAGEAPPEWGGQFDQVVIEGPVVSEVIFHHRESQCVIIVDMIENFEPDRINNVFWRVGGKLAGVLDPDGKAPADYRRTFSARLEQVGAALSQVIGWQPERAVMAHGRPYTHNAKAELERSFRWAVKA